MPRKGVYPEPSIEYGAGRAEAPVVIGDGQRGGKGIEMFNGLLKNGNNHANEPAPVITPEQEPLARVMLLGGATGALPRLSTQLAQEFAAQSFIAAALHTDDPTVASRLAEAGCGLVSRAGMHGDRLEETSFALGEAKAIGAGETESLANAPVVLCVNGIRIGFLGYSERRAGEFDKRADILGLMAVDQVRMLLNQCDHVIVFVRAGLHGARLPLPEWRARYRRFIDAGASIVVDTGETKGWETYRNGIICYGLGAPEGAHSLAVMLTLRQNGRQAHQIRALEAASGELRTSEDEAFLNGINEQNNLLNDDKAYHRAVDEMCLAYYASHEEGKKQGPLKTLLSGGAESARRAEEEKLLSLLGDESRRFMALRALTLRNKE